MVAIGSDAVRVDPRAGRVHGHVGHRKPGVSMQCRVPHWRVDQQQTLRSAECQVGCARKLQKLWPPVHVQVVALPPGVEPPR